VFPFLGEKILPVCRDCGVEISGEQHDKYFKRCLACYQKYKKKIGNMYIGFSFACFGFSAVHWFFLNIDYSICFFLLGQLSLFKGWEMRATEIVTRKWNKKRAFLRDLVDIPSMLLVCTLLILRIISLI